MLNLHNRTENPCFESHDPGMMYDPVSGYCYSYSTDGGITTPYCQGIQIRRSKDMVDFEYVLEWINVVVASVAVVKLIMMAIENKRASR